MLCSVIVLSWCNSATETSPLIPQASWTPTPVAAEEQEPIDFPTIDMNLPTQANMYYVKLDDAGKEGKMIGCNDSLVSASSVLDTLFTSWDEVLTYVYTLQLWAKAQPDGTMTTLTPALQVEKVLVKGSNAAIALSGSLEIGWACDAPRIKEQLTAVATQFDQIKQVVITINGTPLDEYLSTK